MNYYLVFAFFILSFSGPIQAKENKVSLDLASLGSQVIIQMKPNRNHKSESFTGVVDCSQSGETHLLVEATDKCLGFTNQSSTVTHVPFFILKTDLDSPEFKDLMNSLSQRHSKMQTVTDKKMKWGKISIWKSEGVNSVYYVFLSPTGKKQILRVGPLPEKVYAQYVWTWGLKLW